MSNDTGVLSTPQTEPQDKHDEPRYSPGPHSQQHVEDMAHGTFEGPREGVFQYLVHESANVCSDDSKPGNVEAGMTFCPGISYFAVARFLPPGGGRHDMGGSRYRECAVMDKGQCQYYGRRRGEIDHVQVPGKLGWAVCSGKGFFDGEGRETVFCPGLYVSIGELERIYHWPVEAEPPSYLHCKPSGVEHEILRRHRFIEGNSNFSHEGLPRFTQKALDCGGEFEQLKSMSFDQLGYDIQTMTRESRSEALE